MNLDVRPQSRIEHIGITFDDQSLPRLGGKFVEVNIGRTVHPSEDGRPDGQRHRLVENIVGLDFEGLWSAAHVELAGVTDTPQSLAADFMRSDWSVRRGGDNEDAIHRLRLAIHIGHLGDGGEPGVVEQ